MVFVKKESILPSDINLRRGSFSISTDLLDKATPELFEFMSNFIIIRAECLYFGDMIKYQAVSPLFDKIDEGVVIPEYDFEITRKVDGSINIKTIKLSGDGKQLLRKLRKLDG